MCLVLSGGEGVVEGDLPVMEAEHPRGELRGVGFVRVGEFGVFWCD